MTDEGKTQIAVRLSSDLLARVDAYRAHVMAELPGHDFTRVDAIRVLLERGLAHAGHGSAPSAPRDYRTRKPASADAITSMSKGRRGVGQEPESYLLAREPKAKPYARSAQRSQLQLSVELDRRQTVSAQIARRRLLPAVGLFAGIGGIERGLEAAGHETLMVCEIEPTARAVLDHHFPKLKKHDDVTTLRDIPAGTRLLAGGFPCQDLSQAGQTRGIDGMRSGLVREALRLAAQRKVKWLLLENVPFMLQLGRGRALDVIVSALEELGYAWAYRVVDARAFGLPQRRERVFLVASLEDDPRGVLFADEVGTPDEPQLDGKVAAGFYWTEGLRGLGWAVDAVPTLKGGSTVGVASPPAIWLPDGRIVTPSIEDAEALQGFPRGWTQPAEKVAKKGFRWKLVGNAVSVPAFEWLGERLAAPGDAILRNVAPIQPNRMWPNAAFNVGEGRLSNDLSKWPKHSKAKHLHEFVEGTPALLSRRATAGFLERTKKASLRFPPGFIEAVSAHLRRMERQER